MRRRGTLFDLGHIDVGQIAAPHDSRSQKRIDGYMRAVKEFGSIPMVVSLDQPSSVPLGGSCSRNCWRAGQR